MAKLSREVIQQIKDKRASGKSFIQISEELNLPLSTVNYHLNEGYKKYKQDYERDKGKLKRTNYTPEQRKRRNEYSKKYFKDRYQSDPEFRRKHIARVIKRQKMILKSKGGKK
jgi:DNA-binding transcriptional ArsR family regulator